MLVEVKNLILLRTTEIKTKDGKQYKSFLFADPINFDKFSMIGDFKIQDVEERSAVHVKFSLSQEDRNFKAFVLAVEQVKGGK